jgi:hypothetical protein
MKGDGSLFEEMVKFIRGERRDFPIAAEITPKK